MSLIGAALFSPLGDFGACMRVMKVPKEKGINISYSLPSISEWIYGSTVNKKIPKSTTFTLALIPFLLAKLILCLKGPYQAPLYVYVDSIRI